MDMIHIGADTTDVCKGDNAKVVWKLLGRDVLYPLWDSIIKFTHWKRKGQGEMDIYEEDIGILKKMWKLSRL